MGCMPYGLFRTKRPSRGRACFNPSYGLHALRASTTTPATITTATFQSLIWVACPTGYASIFRNFTRGSFQSLIWVACPTGADAPSCWSRTARRFQSLIWVACPTGTRNRTNMITCPIASVSIPHMGCMPYGLLPRHSQTLLFGVSIPHMGCMPYGQVFPCFYFRKVAVSIPHMGCMPYGPVFGSEK